MINELTALELGELIKYRKISCEEAAKSLLEAIRVTDAKIGAYITVDENETLAQARAVQSKIDKKELSSPIAGVPVSIKDNICTKNIRTTSGSKMLLDYKPVYNATVIEKLQTNGAVILGKLNMDEFAMGSSTETSYFGVVKNPWNTQYVPGGSSGGAAAAIAANEAIYAIASDTGGSIRQPASFCGVTGIKPTYGSTSRYGLIAYASSLEQIGPMGKDIRDCAAVLEIITGRDKKDSTSIIKEPFKNNNTAKKNIKNTIVGIPINYLSKNTDIEIQKAIKEAAETLKQLGATIMEFEMPLMDYATAAYYIIACAEASANLSRYDGIRYGYRSEHEQEEFYIKTRSESLGMEVKRRIMLGTYVLSANNYNSYYQKATEVRKKIQYIYNQTLKKYDIILSPVTPSSAYKIGEKTNTSLKMYKEDIYTVPVNLAGLPAIALPCGFNSSNMPIGMQIIGKPYSEADIIQIADIYQQNTNYHKRKCT